MAQPMFDLIDQAVRQFYDQWSYGLQPSVVIETQSNGVVNIINKVACILPSTTQQHQAKRRRSGRSSRLRRRESRDYVPSKNKNSAESQDQEEMLHALLLPDHEVEVQSIELMKPDAEPIQSLEVKEADPDVTQADIRKCIELLEKEIRKKDDLIFKLQLKLADLKFESYLIKPEKNLTMQHVSAVDIPPSQPNPQISQTIHEENYAFTGLPYLPRYGGAC